MAVEYISHMVQAIRIPITALTATETDTGYDIPQDAIVLDVFLNITTAEATATTKTIDVGTMGTSNDPDGFLDGASTAATGAVTGTLDSGGQTKGALLRADESGAGVLVPMPNVTAGKTNDSLSYTFAEAQNELAGEIVLLMLLPE